MDNELNKAILDAMQLISSKIPNTSKIDFSVRNEDIKLHALSKNKRQVCFINIVIEEQV